MYCINETTKNAMKSISPEIIFKNLFSDIRILRTTYNIFYRSTPAIVKKKINFMLEIGTSTFCLQNWSWFYRPWYLKIDDHYSIDAEDRTSDFAFDKYATFLMHNCGCPIKQYPYPTTCTKWESKDGYHQCCQSRFSSLLFENEEQFSNTQISFTLVDY